MLPTAITSLNNRRGLPNALIALGLNGCGVEVGVNHGFFSDRLLRQSNLEHLFAVDLWERDGDEASQLNYIRAAARLAMHRTRVSLLRMESGDACQLFPNESLDVVFIDADHRYDPVMRDMELWYPKIKPGGVLSGHDYWVDRPDNCTFNDVKRAVDHFMDTQGLEFHVSNDDHKMNNGSWYTMRPQHVSPHINNKQRKGIDT
jgi:predicted O-methyltransferase YrrM